jgi:hypothetical protein
MYNYKTLLIAYLIVKLDGLVEEYEKLNLFKELERRDIAFDEKQIELNEHLMITMLKAMKIENAQSSEYNSLVIDTLTKNGFMDAREVIQFLED